MRGVRAGLLAILALAAMANPARAELFQEGDLRASFEGAITPKKLPRDSYAPVGVRVAGGVRALGGSRLPQLRTIRVAINEAGRLYDKGLPTCEVERIQPATEEVARRICGDAIVGGGRVSLVVRLSGQRDFVVRGKLLAFNGPRRGKRKLILAQIYSHNPPGAFILTFTVRRRAGVFGTEIATELPSYARGWAYLTFFEMTLDRTYRHAGELRSYVSAACSAPAGFTKAVFPFAKASYGFAGGQVLSTSIQRTCQVAGA
jgi:hypothetical protein